MANQDGAAKHDFEAIKDMMRSQGLLGQFEKEMSKEAE